MKDNIVWFPNCKFKDKNLLGGKNISLGELSRISKDLGFEIADGFAITTQVYDTFIIDIKEWIENKLSNLDIDNLNLLDNTSQQIKNKISNHNLSCDLKQEILDNFNLLRSKYDKDISVAVRSSAIAEDLPNASFAGQHDTFLNISSEKKLIKSIIDCFASLFNSRAISYRYVNKVPWTEVKISVAIQKMVRSDIGSSGVAFSLDTETGYDRAIIINSSFGLGETIVGGIIIPDEFILDKRVLLIEGCDPIIEKKLGNKETKMIYQNNTTQLVNTNNLEKKNYSLTDDDIIKLGKFILKIEKSYRKLLDKNIGMDIEWAYDGIDKNIYILQARPETIYSNNKNLNLEKYSIEKKKSKYIVKGVAVGNKVSTGKVNILSSINEFDKFNKGDILVTSMTTPDWEPIMKISSGIITDKGGRTCHAAIIAREFGIPTIVGCENATSRLSDKEIITISCCEGEIGYVYGGEIRYQKIEIPMNYITPSKEKVMLNIGNPENVFANSLLPNNGVGLTRLEFIINNYIKVHPKLLLQYPNIPNKYRKPLLNIINEQEPIHFFIKKLAKGISKIASAFYPKKVIVRLSDFKSNEYRNLLGGELYEPIEENPMLGFRGASRYYDESFIDCFHLECEALLYAREKMMMDNIMIMIPFCRTPEECKKVLQLMSEHSLYSGRGLVKGGKGLEIFLMCELPSNVIEADKFSKYIDGVSIGGNDLLQLTLGLDRDSEKISHLSDYHNISYKRLINQAICDYQEKGIKVGFCGQQPSDDAEFANFLINSGIDTISVTPDSLLKTLDKIDNNIKCKL